MVWPAHTEITPHSAEHRARVAPFHAPIAPRQAGQRQLTLDFIAAILLAQPQAPALPRDDTPALGSSLNLQGPGSLIGDPVEKGEVHRQPPVRIHPHNVRMRGAGVPRHRQNPVWGQIHYLTSVNIDLGVAKHDLLAHEHRDSVGNQPGVGINVQEIKHIPRQVRIKLMSLHAICVKADLFY